MTACARYALSDGTLCSTHNERFASQSEMRCAAATPRKVIRPAGETPDTTWDEPRFQRWVVATARANGWRVRVLDVRTGKIRRAQVHEKGWPDLVMVHPVKGVVWLELKAEGGKIREEQGEMLDVLLKGGATAYILQPSQWQDLMVGVL